MERDPEKLRLIKNAILLSLNNNNRGDLTTKQVAEVAAALVYDVIRPPLSNGHRGGET